jgi:Tfp pilus assembly protein PilP
MWCAVLLAKLIWWIITPAYNEVYVDRVRINQKDNSVKYIINRYPFGEVVIVKPKDMTPAFGTLVKLHGVYVSGSDSMAFIVYNDKSQAIKVGDNISATISLTQVLPDSIIITQNGVDATIKMTKSNAVVNNNSNRTFNYQNSNQNNLNNSPDNTNNASALNGSNNTNDLIEKRKELIEKFAKQEVDTDNTDNSKKSNSN